MPRSGDGIALLPDDRSVGEFRHFQHLWLNRGLYKKEAFTDQGISDSGTTFYSHWEYFLLHIVILQSLLGAVWHSLACKDSVRCIAKS